MATEPEFEVFTDDDGDPGIRVVAEHDISDQYEPGR